MPSLTLSNRLIWFAHCPKAGGTSVEQFMVAQWGDAVGHLHWGWDLWWHRGGWRVADPPNSPQHLIWDDALSILPQAPDTVFAVVRDPVARMASEHRWQRRGRRATWIGKLVAWLPFSFWLRLMLAAARQHPHVFDNHLRPQTHFIPDTAQVFRLEDGLDQVAVWLAGQAGIQKPGASFPHAIPSGTKARLTASDRSLIGQAFAVDFDRFGYARPKEAHIRTGRTDRVADWLAPVIVFLDRHGRL